MTPKYCYWSVATGPYGVLMESCVRTARRAGVFREFHVLTDRPLEGCECYDAYQCDKADGMFKLHYLKVGVSRLLFDYFIWLDADTIFTHNPVDVLAPLDKSPIHVPLELSLTQITEDREWRGTSCIKLRELFREKGISNTPYLSGSAFWIVHREAIDEVYELATQFWSEARQIQDVLTTDRSDCTDGIASHNRTKMLVTADAALGYAMQILCADPEAHRLEAHPDVWASDDTGRFTSQPPNGQPWSWRHPLSDCAVEVRPAIVHLRHSSRRELR